MKKKITILGLITLLANINSILDLIGKIFSINFLIIINMRIILDFVGIIGVFCIALYLLNQYEKVKDEMKAFNIISNLRNKYFYNKSFEDNTYYRLPNESDEDLFKRLPQGQYIDYLKKEYLTSKNIIINKLNKRPAEAQKLLDKIYNIKKQTK